MPEFIKCPECSRQLRVPDDLLGRKVTCPSCSSTFTAIIGAEGEAAEAPRRPPETEEAGRDEERRVPPRRSRPRPPEDDDYDDDYDDRPRRRRPRGEPHRGAMILTFGILSLVMCGP